MATADGTQTIMKRKALGVEAHLFQSRSRMLERREEALCGTVDTRHEYGSEVDTGCWGNVCSSSAQSFLWMSVAKLREVSYDRMISG
jgi:hypothetical protein